jgi:cell division protein FtsB
MKTKVGMAVLIVVCIGLMVALLKTRMDAAERQRVDADAIIGLSNQLTTATENLFGLRQVNLALTNNLVASRQEVLTFSNRFTETSGTLAVTKTSLQNARTQITNLNGYLASWEAYAQLLNQRAAALTNAIISLDAQIARTQKQLAGTETNNAFLERELQQQTAARFELESKFNNLSTVRAQAKKLHDDMLVGRRLEWMHQGAYTSAVLQKGGQLLMQRTPPPDTVRPPHYDLNVEVSSDGSIHVIPMPTNAPAAATNLPAQ